MPATTSTPPTPQSRLSAAILSSIAVRVTSSQYALTAYACCVMVQACILVEVLNLLSICSQNERASPRVASPLMKRSSAAAACVMSSSLDESESPSTAKANWGPGGSSGWSAAKLSSCCTAAGARGSAPKFGCAGCCPNWNGCCRCCSAASSSSCSGGGCDGCAGAGGALQSRLLGDRSAVCPP